MGNGVKFVHVLHHTQHMRIATTPPIVATIHFLPHDSVAKQRNNIPLHKRAHVSLTGACISRFSSRQVIMLLQTMTICVLTKTTALTTKILRSRRKRSTARTMIALTTIPTCVQIMKMPLLAQSSVPKTSAFGRRHLP